jgi:raffinose/stachyose/melibiose transport system substrate-binding protein
MLFTGLLAGCSSGNEPATSEGGQEGTTLTLLMDNQTSPAGIEAVAKEFEKKTNIKTEIELRPGGGEGDNLVKTRLATGDMTDLVYYNSGSLMQALNPEQNFVDLSSEPFMDTLIDSYKQTVASGDKVFGIPVGSVMVGAWFYNKKVYEELGLSVPKTWDELMANNEKIKAAGKTAVIGTFKDDWTTQLVFLADNYNVLAESPNFADDFTANKAKIASTPAALRSFEKLAELHEKGYLNEDFLATNYDAGLKMLAEGTGAHYPMLSFAIPVLAQNFPDQIEDIGIFAQPGDSAEDNGITAWMPASVYINKNSDKTDAAKEWVEYFVSPEATEIYMSAVKPEGPYAIKDVELPDDVYGAVKDVLPYFNEGKTAPALEFLSPLKGPNLPQITTQVGSGISTPEEGAELYDKDVEKQAKQLGLEGW